MEKKGIKSLLPSLKERKRYLAFEIISESRITDFNAVSSEIIYNTTKFISEYGLAYAGIQVLPDKFKNNKGIMRINHKYLDHSRAALALIKNIGQQDAAVRSLGASGTLKKAEKYVEVLIANGKR